jgi:hypothetical protein
MKHVIYTLLFATVAGALTFGAATSLQVSSANLGSGGAEVDSCDPDGVEVTYNLAKSDPSRISGIVVSGIAKECKGQTLHYVVKSKGEAKPLFGSRVIASIPSETFAVLNLTVEQIDEIGITIAG